LTANGATIALNNVKTTGAQSYTGSTSTTLNGASYLTAANTFGITGAALLGANTTIDTTNSGGFVTGANINFSNAITGNGNNLTLNMGSLGVLSASSFNSTGNLSIVNSGGVSFSGSVNAGTVTLTNTTGNIAFNGALTATILSTAAQGYNLQLNNGSTITNAATLSNTGGVTLVGTNTFSGGLTSIASTTTINGNVRSSGQIITLNAVVLTGASNIDTTIGAAAGAAINISGTINNAQTLTLTAGTSGAISLSGAVGATTALTSLTANGATIALNNVKTTGAQSYTGSTSTTLNGTSYLTAANTFGITGAALLGANTTIDTTNSGGSSAGANINFSSTINNAKTLTLTAGTSGAISLSGAVGATTALTSLTANGATIALNNVKTSGTQSYTGSTSTTLNGTSYLTAANTFGITGAALLGANATIDTTNGGASSAGANINFSSTINNAQTLILTAGTSGAISLSGAVGATTALTSLTANGATIALNNVKTTGAQSYTGSTSTTLNGASYLTAANTFGITGAALLGANTTIDTTNSGGFVTGANINFSNAITGNGNNLTLNMGSLGVLSASSFNSTGNLSIVNSGGVSFSGSVNAGTVTLTNTTGNIAFNGALTATILSTAAQGYNLQLNAGSTITNAAILSNTGGVTLAGTNLFTGGLTSIASTTNINGSVLSSAQGITLAGVTVNGNSTIDTANSGSSPAGAAITLGAITNNSNSNTLTLNSGNNTGISNTITGTTITGSGNLTIANSHGVNFSGAVNVGTLMLTNTTGNIVFNSALSATTLSTAAQGYNLQLNAGSTITNAATLSNTGGVTLAGTNLFTGGLTSTASTTSVNGSVLSSAQGITLAGVTVNGSSTIDTTNSGASPAGAAITLGAIANSASSNTLTLNSGNNTGTSNTITGTTITGSGNLTIANSHGVNFSGAVNAGTITLTNTTGNIAFNGALTATTLSTAAQGYNLQLNAGSTITNAATLSNTGGVTLAGTNVFTAGLTSIASTTNLNGNVLSNGHVITLGTVTLSGTSSIDSTDGGLSSGAAININSTIDNAQDLTLTAGTGSITLSGAIGATTALNSLTANGATIAINNVQTTGAQNYTSSSSTTLNGTSYLTSSGSFSINGSILLGGNTTIDTTNINQTSGANINLGSTTGSSNNLTLNAGSGGVISGSSFNSTGNLIITNSNGTTFSGAINAGSVILTNTIGNITFNGALTATNLSTASQGYGLQLNSGSTITNATTLLNTGGVTLSGTNTFNNGLTSTVSTTTVNGSIQTGSDALNLGTTILSGTSTLSGGAITLSGNVSGNGFGLIINNSDNSTITGIFDGTTSTLTKNGNGILELLGANQYSGGTTINVGLLTVSNNNGLGLGGAVIASGSELLLNAVTLNNNITVSGTGINNSGAIATTGTATNTINGNVTLSGDTSFVSNVGDTLKINGAIDGAQNLTIMGNGNLDLQSSNVGLQTELSSLTINVTGAVDLHNVSTSGDQIYTGSSITAHSNYISDLGNIVFNTPLVLLSDSTMTATTGTISLNTVDGGFNLGLTAGTTININQPIGSIIPLNSLTTSGRVIIGSNITTTGAQTYHSLLTLVNDVSLTMNGSSNLSIGAGVNGFYNLNLVGGSNNTFNLSGSLSVNNIIVTGGTGFNTLNVNNAQNQTWTITNTDSGSVSGIAELPNGISFTNIQNWQSGTGTNTLIGSNIDNTWTITGINSGTVTGLSSGFSNFQNLIGGNSANAFILNGGTLSGSINGSSGNSSLTGDNVANTWVIADTDSGTVTGVSGGFINIQNLIGGSSINNFTLSGGTLSGSITGGTGFNSLTADNVTNTWVFTGVNAGSVTGVNGGFSNIQTVTGGSGNDAFTFNPGGSVANLNGGAGTNTLDYSNYGSSISFTIGGIGVGITNSNSGITRVVGALVGGNTLTATNIANTWNITSDNAGTVTGGLTDGFAQFNNLVGGTNNDTFVFADGVKITGTINGGAGGVNTLDLSNYTTTTGTVLTSSGVNGFTGTTTGFLNPTGGFSNITNLNGNVATLGSLTGENTSNTWSLTGINNGTYNDGTHSFGFSNVRYLNGGSGNDNFIFSDGMGVTGVIKGNAGTNTFDYRAYTTAVTANLASNAQTGTLAATQVSILYGGMATNTLRGSNIGNTWNITSSNDGTIVYSGNTVPFHNFANLVGGTGFNAFVFSGSSGITGTLNGGGSNTNTLNYSAYSSPANINFASLTASGIAGGISNINAVVGQGSSTLTAANTANTWNITGNNSGNINSAITFSGISHLVGGTGNDSFVFSNSSSSVNSINGGGGTDTLNYSAYNNAQPVAVNLALGTTPAVTNFSNITNFIGGLAANTITGANTANVWNITGANAGNINSTITFSKFGALVGGTAGDTFNINAGGSLTGSITGNGSSSGNKLSYNSYSSAVSVNLVNSTATGIGGYTNIANFTGTSAMTNSTLTGQNATTTWNITGTNAGNLVVGSSTIANFTQFGNLVGGNLNDSFVFSNAANVTGTINGGSGSNTLNYSAYTTPVNVATGGLTNISNILGSASFASTNTLTGPTSGNNTWTLTAANAGTISGSNTFTFSNFGTWVGGTGSINTLVAQNVTNTWNITGVNSGNLNNAINFSGFGGLTGGSANDTFIFSNGASISNLINGGAGTNTLNYSADTSSLSLNLVTLNNISSIIGPSNATLGTLIGSNNTNTWNISSNNGGNVVTGSTTITFSHFGNLVGGSLNDSFVFSNNAGVNSINGGAGNNTFDYSATTNTNPITINLANGSVSSINSFIGPTNIGSGNNTLIGSNNSSNTWSISSNNGGNINSSAITFSNFGNLTGGTAGDTFVFGNSSVRVSGVISNGALNYSSYNNTTPVNINLAAGTATATAGISGITNIIGGLAVNTITGANTANTWNITGTNVGSVNGTSFTNFSQLVGGTAGNTFTFNNAASVSTINGGIGGVNTLDYTAYSIPVTINLSASTAPGLTGVFSNITNFNANSSNAANNNLIAQNASNVWTINANNGGNINGTTTFSNFGNLTGGTGNDTFTFNDGKVIAGIIDGGAGGTNILDLSNYSTAVGVTLSSATVFGYSGITTGIPNPMGGFARITQVNGGTSNANTSLSTENTLTTVTLTGNNSGTLDDGTSTLTFNTIGTLVGGTGNNKLIGTNNTTTWNITGNNAGNVNSAINFSGFGNLVGGSGNDSFTFSNGVNIGGSINGGGGTNSLNYSAYTSALNFNLESGLFSNISSIVGPTTASLGTLTGINNTNIWNITSNNAGNIVTGSSTMTFTHFGNLVGGNFNDTFVFTNNASAVSINGGAGTNTFDYSATTNTNPIIVNLANGSVSSISNFIGPINISGNNTLIGANSSSNTWNITSNNGGNINNNAIIFSNFGNLTGGTAGDAFVLTNSSVSISGVISNGSLNYSSYNNTVPVNVNLAAGTATGTGGISNITNIVGGSAINTITGANTANTWNITGTNAGNVNGISFTNFSQLIGGTAGNTFAFNNGASVSTVNGGIGGVNTLDYTAYSAPITVNLSASTAPGLTGVFSNITNFNANSSNTASNNLIGQNASNVWTISANNGGNINGTTTFSNFGNLTGGTGNDTFTFNDGKVIAGIIDGGANGTNILDLSNYSTAVGITLSSATASGYSGTTTGTPNPTGSFARMTQVNGGTSNGSANTSLSTENTLTTVTLTGNNSGTLNDGIATLTFNTIGTLVGGAGNNKLIGTNNATTWNITGNNAGNLNSAINFSGFGNLVGGSGNDSFIFSNGVNIGGAINGGGGTNSLNYSAYTSALNFNLGSGLFPNISSIVGPSTASLGTL